MSTTQKRSLKQWSKASATVSAAGTFPLGPLSLAALLVIDINLSALTGGGGSTITFFYERLGEDGNWYPVWSPAGLTAAGNLSTDIGIGAATNFHPGDEGRVRWAVSGGTSPTFTFSLSARSFLGAQGHA